MSKKYQNGFFVFGLVVLVIMVTQLDFREVWSGLQRAGYWFFAVVALWLGLYVINTLSWYVIIRQGGSGKDKTPFSFWWLYKVTVSGFALNYATPGGLMGGEAYRIMELAPKIGTERASSSVILYVMTHIFSHFWFWLLSVGIYLITQSPTMPIAVILALTTAFCMLGIWFFMRGYKKGLAMMLTRWLSKMPWMGKWARRLMEKQGDKLREID
ncbi:MAG: lysylphosphatidylglycerol synthase transmembrane domain-containing protein, partial [Prevotella pectinovora]